MTKEQKETELTLEERFDEDVERITLRFWNSQMTRDDWRKHLAQEIRIISNTLVGQEKETEQSLKQKVEKMLEGLIKQNEEAPPADKEEEIDERAYRQALEEAKNKLKDL